MKRTNNPDWGSHQIDRQPGSGFTIVELLIVIAIIAVLASLLFPALSRAKAKAQGVACANNLKQLQIGWIMYVQDHNDWLVPNNPPNWYPNGQRGPTWAMGDMRYGNPDGTNVDYVVGEREGSLGPYVRTHRIFKCPSDRSVTKLADGNSYPRVRSYSMNEFMGTQSRAGTTGTPEDTWAIFMKQSDLNSRIRPEFFVFMDVHEDFLMDCLFDLSNDDLFHELWGELPASSHGGSGTLSLNDGHVEIHRWRDAVTLQPIRGSFRGGFTGPVFAPGSRDFYFAWQRATKNKKFE